MPDPQVLHDDYGDAITVEADATPLDRGGGMTGPPAVLITFSDSPFTDGTPYVRMRLSGERLAAFTEALDRHAGYLAALASGSDDDGS